VNLGIRKRIFLVFIALGISSQASWGAQTWWPRIDWSAYSPTSETIARYLNPREYSPYTLAGAAALGLGATGAYLYYQHLQRLKAAAHAIATKKSAELSTLQADIKEANKIAKTLDIDENAKALYIDYCKVAQSFADKRPSDITLNELSHWTNYLSDKVILSFKSILLSQIKEIKDAIPAIPVNNQISEQYLDLEKHFSKRSLQEINKARNDIIQSILKQSNDLLSDNRKHRAQHSPQTILAYKKELRTIEEILEPLSLIAKQPKTQKFFKRALTQIQEEQSKHTSNQEAQ